MTISPRGGPIFAIVNAIGDLSRAHANPPRAVAGHAPALRGPRADEVSTAKLILGDVGMCGEIGHPKRLNPRQPLSRSEAICRH
jgi:hypothetical protein